MRLQASSGLRALALGLVAAFLAACTDQQAPAGPEGGDLPAPGFSVRASALSGLASDWVYTDEHVVLFRGRVPADLEARIAALGGSVLRVHPEIRVAVVTGLTDDAAARLAAARDIAAAPRDVGVNVIPDLGDAVTRSLPGDAPTPAGHDPTAAFFFQLGFQWDMEIIDADAAWNAGFDDASGVRVAILDTGLDPFHIDLASNIDEASSVAFVPSFNGAGPVWGDDYFHGTHVGGTVTTNGIGTSGVAPHATLIAVKVCGFLLDPGDPDFLDVVGCPFGAIISGLVHAAHVNADVVNMSLGGFINIPAPGGGQLNAALNRAVNFASSRGTLVVSSAGNEAIDLDHIERDFREFKVNAIRLTPCESGNGMCVSATGPTDALSSFSNFGHSAIDVAAPGGDFAVTGDPVTSMVLAPCSTLSLIPGLAVCAANGFYLFAQGTSMAAPHVSGAAALLDAQFGGGLNAGRLMSAVQRAADDLGNTGNEADFGAGRTNVCNLVNC